MKNYSPIDKSAIPIGVRFDVPRRNHGQIVEIAYGGFGRHEHDDGAPYKRQSDGSDGSVTYYKLSTEQNQ